MYTLPNKYLANLAEKLPSTESLLRLQQELEKNAAAVDAKERSEHLVGLSGHQVDQIISEIVALFRTPLGSELMIAVLPALIEVSKQGSRASHHSNHT